MKELLKKIIPRKIIVITFDILTFIGILLFSFRYKPLIIRKNTSDWSVFKAIFVRGEFKLPVKIKPSLIIDAGAYSGLSTLYFSSIYPNAKIIAIEPEFSNFELLERHTKKLSQVTRVKGGVWSHKAFLKVIDRGLDKWGFGVEEVKVGDEYDVEAFTINEILDISGCEKIDILKLDIEGSEKQLFSEGYKNWLPKVNILIIELHDFLVEGCSDALYSAIKKEEWIEYKKGEKLVLVRKELI